MKPSNQLKVSWKQVNGHHVATCGCASLKVYKAGGRADQDLYEITYYLGSLRKRVSRVGWDVAKAEAETIIQDLSRGDAAIAPVTAQDRVILQRAQASLEAHGVAVDEAAGIVAKMRQELNGASIDAIIADWKKRHPKGVCQKTVAEVKDELLAARLADGCGDRHTKDLKLRLGKFAEAFNQMRISDVTTEAISGWLRGLKKRGGESDCVGRSRNNYRNAVRNLFRYAVAKKYIPEDQIDWDEDNGVAIAKEEQQPIDIFTPAELQKLIQAARVNPEHLPNGFNKRYATAQGLLPLLVLGAFCGLRTSEVCAQDWADINLERGFLRVTKAKGNTPARRLVPISENAKAWLALCKREEGVCCEHVRPEDPIKRLAERAGLEWKHNALRHSFISYRLAEVKNTAQVAYEAGNSPRMIEKHYKELVAEEDATVWFAIRPEAPANVTPMPLEEVA